MNVLIFRRQLHDEEIINDFKLTANKIPIEYWYNSDYS